MSNCTIEGCVKRASFDNHGPLAAIRCSDHKVIGMVDVLHRVQVVCEIEGCVKRASFNNHGALTAIDCGDHKVSGMVRVV